MQPINWKGIPHDRDAPWYMRPPAECHPVGSYGTVVASLARPPGHYHDEATPHFALLLLQNGGFAAEFDLGVGRFLVKSAPGQIFVSRPFTAVENTFQGTARTLVLSLSETGLSTLLPALHLEPENGLRELYTRPLCDEFIRIAINQIWATTRSRQDADSLFVDTAVLATFAALARHGRRGTRPARRGLADWQLRRAIELLESMGDIALSDLAASANMSPWYFARAFKHTTGLPPHRYQLMLRMNCAKDLLKETRLSIREIAERVGYASSQALARAFHKAVGTSPLAYRHGATA